MLDSFYSTSNRKGFHWPGRLLFGEGSLIDAQKIVEEFNNPFLVLDQAFGEYSFPELIPSKRFIVSSEPRGQDTDSAIALIGEDPIDVILAIGGGSTIDFAKLVAYHARFKTIFKPDRERDRTSPALIVVPTLSGSGSETSRFFVVSDSKSGQKNSFRSWSNVPDVTVVDPQLIATAGRDRLILGAFDSFLHLWETFVCRNERNPYTNMLALTHIPEIILSVGKLLESQKLQPQYVSSLSLASAMGGIAISNVRTGLIHTLGESLASQVRLSHPLSLAVFFEAVFIDYSTEVEDLWKTLQSRLDDTVPLKSKWCFHDLVFFWKQALTEVNANASIINAFSKVTINRNNLCETIDRDTVLIKEHPSLLTPQDIRCLVERSLATYI